MNTLKQLALALVSLSLLSGGAQAAVQCGPHDKIAEVLGTRFQETRQALGLTGNIAVVELYVSERGTWTLTTSDVAGLTCIVASGEDWQDFPRKVAGLES